MSMSKAWKEGYSAFLSGISDPPYDHGTPEYKDWAAGWWQSYNDENGF